jgi:transcriptional regulator with XRE-family HTH domain
MISAIETGLREGSVDTLAKFAKVLGVPVSYLAGEELEDWREGAGREGILKDAEAAPGLRDLARRVDLCEAHDITVKEWNSLRSLVTEVSMTKEGYVALLMLIRSCRQEK